jgi:hypothetical protein
MPYLRRVEPPPIEFEMPGSSCRSAPGREFVVTMPTGQASQIFGGRDGEITIGGETFRVERWSIDRSSGARGMVTMRATVE